MTLVYRARGTDDLVFRAELDPLAARAGAASLPARAAGRDAARGCPASAGHLDDADALRHLVPDVATHDVFVCGAEPGWTPPATPRSRAGVPAEHIHLERFAW